MEFVCKKYRKLHKQEQKNIFVPFPFLYFVKFDSVESCFDFIFLRCDFDVSFKEGNNDGSLLWYVEFKRKFHLSKWDVLNVIWKADFSSDILISLERKEHFKFWFNDFPLPFGFMMINTLHVTPTHVKESCNRLLHVTFVYIENY